MIELPEALTIANQVTRELAGKRIKACIRGNSPHKFALYSGSPEEYQAILAGKTVGQARAHGCMILVDVEPDHVFTLGGGGERILLHKTSGTLPKKHQLLLEFTDGTFLTVSVQGWGSVSITPKENLPIHQFCGVHGPSPLSVDFTLDYFLGLFEELEKADSRSAKFFIISKPGVHGIGNGCLQDILFRAKIHPRRRMVETTPEERMRLYESIRTTIREAAELGGRDSELDLFGQPGGYSRILDSKSVGRPCPECGTPIGKISFLGGAAYFCPNCQV